MLFTARVLPVIFVDNKTNEDIENIYFTYEGNRDEDPRISKIKSGKRDTACMYSRGNSSTKILIMYHYDKNKVRHQYEIFDNLGFDYISSIKIEILDINEDGSFKYKIEKNSD